MLAVSVSLLWDWRTVMFIRSGFYYNVAIWEFEKHWGSDFGVVI